MCVNTLATYVHSSLQYVCTYKQIANKATLWDIFLIQFYLTLCDCDARTFTDMNSYVAVRLY